MHMDLVKRNAEIVALVKARKMSMRKIAARYRLSTSSISLIAIRHGVHAQAPDPKKVRAASKLIQRGMPLRHVAQTLGLSYQRLRQLLAEQGVYKVPPPNRLWSERELRILRRDYGKPGRSLRTIATKIGRTCQAVNLKAALLGLSWPPEFRASAKGTSKLSSYQRAEALRRLTAGESCRAIARTFEVHHSTISRLARLPPIVNCL
jgi:lambda repressor-like predicted transcriptional regulator